MNKYKFPKILSAFLISFSLILFLSPKNSSFAEVNSVTPSTNSINEGLGWAHVNQLSKDVGSTELEFVSTRGFASCFEYRTDGDTSQKIDENNYNTLITDGLYPFVCVNNSTQTKTITADEYVEVRMVFGAESDERFDWTRFDVDVAPSKPVLEYPINGEYINDNTPLMQWSDSTIPSGSIAGYYYRIFYNCSDLNNIPSSCSVYPNLDGLWRTSSEYQAGTTADRTYYWQVQAESDLGVKSEWSDIETFTIDTVLPAAPTDIRILDHEGNNLGCGGYTNNRRITVDWQHPNESEVAYYRFDIKDKDNHTQPLNSEYDATIRDIDGYYKYRVWAVDYAGNMSTESSGWCGVTLDRIDLEILSVEFDKPIYKAGDVMELTLNVRNNSPISTDKAMDTLYAAIGLDRYTWQNHMHREEMDIPNILSGEDGSIKYFITIPQPGSNLSHPEYWTDDTAYTVSSVLRMRNGYKDYSTNNGNYTFAIDNTPPEITWDNPIDGSTYDGTITLRAICNEECDYINFWWRKDDQSYSNISPDRRYHYERDNGTIFEWDLDTLNAELWDGDGYYIMDDGTYYLYAAGKDVVGNWAKTNEIEIIVDNTPPVTTLNPEIEGTFTNQSISIEGESIDALSGVDFVDLYYRKNGTETWLPITQLDNTNDNTPYTWSYDWTPSEEGTYDIKASATDTVGNQEQSPQLLAITYDITPPEIKLVDIIDGSLNISTDDILSGTKTVEIKIGDGQWISYTPDMNLNELVNNEPGEYIVYIRVTDKAGNVIEDTTTFVIEEPEEDTGDVAGVSTKKEDDTEGSVLGASTTLPATGASTYLTIGAIISMISGVIILFVLNRKKKLV